MRTHLEFEFGDPRAKPSYVYKSVVVPEDGIVLLVTEQPVEVPIAGKVWWTHIFLTPNGEIVHRLMAVENILGGMEFLD